MRLNKKNKRKQANLKRKFANDVRIDVPVSVKAKGIKYTDEELKALADRLPDMIHNTPRKYTTTKRGSKIIEESGLGGQTQYIDPDKKYIQTYTKSSMNPVNHFKTLWRIYRNSGSAGVDKYIATIKSIVKAHKAQEAKQVEIPTS